MSNGESPNILLVGKFKPWGRFVGEIISLLPPPIAKTVQKKNDTADLALPFNTRQEGGGDWVTSVCV
jgi:hypothetical protein